MSATDISGCCQSKHPSPFTTIHHPSSLIHHPSSIIHRCNIRPPSFCKSNPFPISAVGVEAWIVPQKAKMGFTTINPSSDQHCLSNG
jgi:hypothetical protein